MQSNAVLIDAYNNLPELDEADFALEESKKSDIINELINIIVRNGLESTVGVRLLHKHNILYEGELMIEDCFVGDEFTLVTKAENSQKLNKDYVPNSWALRGGEYVPIEFSARNLLTDIEINPDTHPKFFRELAEVLQSHGVDGVLGPSVLGSDFIESHRPKGHSILAEVSNYDERSNILMFARPEANVVGKAVQTHWCVSPDSSSGVVTMVCTRICPSIGNPPKHQGTYQHNQT